MTTEHDDNTKSGEGVTQDMTAPDHTVIIDAPRELGTYRLTRLLGRGGMGEVWQAFDKQLERDVAIKLMRKEMLSNEEAVRRFTREARAVARLNHPNIVQVYAFGDEKGLTYMVMEMVEGETVAQCLKRRCKITLEDALHVILQAIEGLSYANARGIIHRDIKPSNLMLTDDSRVKIADFGLAKMVEHDTQMTAAGTAMGSPNYMSPEQARGEEADHRSDIYALGVSLYQMLCGELPFTASSPVSVLLKQIQEPLPEPEALKCLGNGEVMAVLKKMTAKQPEQRHQTYGDLANALAALQPNLRFKGAHIATASMPAANTPPHVPSLSAGPVPHLSSGASPAGSPVPPPAPPPPAATANIPTPSDQKTAVVSSRDDSHVSATGTGFTEKRHRMLVPILTGIGIILITIPVLLFVLSNREDNSLPARDDLASNALENENTADVTPNGETAIQPTVAPDPSPVPPTVTPVTTPVTKINTSSSPAPNDGGMQPVDITAVFTPQVTPQPGVPTIITPTPDLAAMAPSSGQLILGNSSDASGAVIPLYDSAGNTIGSASAGTQVAMIRPANLNGRDWYVIRHNGGEAFVPAELTRQTALPAANQPTQRTPPAPTPTPQVYVLGTAGAGPTEQVPTFLDRNARNSYKSFSAGTEVGLIETGVTMLRVKTPDDKVVYIYRKMASPK